MAKTTGLPKTKIDICHVKNQMIVLLNNKSATRGLGLNYALTNPLDT